ncbi:MAG: hypothetical protein Kow0029_04250 [Candidatus Rifleibacteriota bacterium]
MFQKSTISIASGFTSTFLLVLACILAAVAKLTAAPLKQIQIFFPGNFTGKSVSLSESFEPLPEGCWKAPFLLKSFTEKSSSINLVIGAGNNSSIYSLPSFLSEGQSENFILDKCKLDGKAIGPEDLLIFRNRLLSPEARLCVLTNLEPVKNFNVFKPFEHFVKDKTSFWLFNYIGRAGFEKLPLQKWGSLVPEDPSRALRRMNPEIGKDDLCVHVAHMSREECVELGHELKKWPGNHIIVQIVNTDIPPGFSVISPERENRIFFVSLEKGWERLPMIKIVRRNSGFPRLSLRMIPYEKADCGNSLKLFNQYREEFEKIINETLTFVPTTINPSTSPFRFNPDLYAEFARKQTRADAAIVIPPEESFKTDNVISVVSCLSSFPNEKLYKFRISGENFGNLVTNLLNHSAQRLRFAGCNFDFFAGRAENVQIGKYEILPHKFYNVCVNKRLVADTVLSKYFSREKMESFDGTTFWDVWKKQLKSHRIELSDLQEP